MPYPSASSDGSDIHVPPPSYRTVQACGGYPETTPLLPHAHQRKPTTSLTPLGLIYGALICMAIGFFLQTPFDSSYRQSARIRWAAQERAHAKVVNEWNVWILNATYEKEKWILDRKAREDQDRREEEDRLNRERIARDSIEWQDYQKFWCVGHGRREYKATLANVPLGFNAMDECYRKTIHINGKDYRPDRCDDQGYCGKVIAHFETDANEYECSGPFFSQVSDKGCVGGSRRYDGKIDNIIEWYSWREVCSTMTASYGNVYLGPGAACSECNHGGCGYWATWLIDDWRCQS